MENPWNEIKNCSAASSPSETEAFELTADSVDYRITESLVGADERKMSNRLSFSNEKAHAVAAIGDHKFIKRYNFEILGYIKTTDVKVRLDPLNRGKEG